MCEGIFLLLMFIGMVKEESRRRPRPLRARTEQWNWTKPNPPSPEAQMEQLPLNEPAGDAHAGGPYASFYPEDDLGGWQGRDHWREKDGWYDEPLLDEEPEHQPEEIGLLDWLILLDE